MVPVRQALNYPLINVMGCLMPSEHLIPTECDGTLEKPELTQNVRETVEYAEAAPDPESPKLMETLRELAAVGKLSPTGLGGSEPT
jgi:hypothetical protein